VTSGVCSYCRIGHGSRRCPRLPGPVLRVHRANPWAGQLPCPECASTAWTMPFDTSDPYTSWLCIDCNVWIPAYHPALASSPPPVIPPATVDGGDDGGAGLPGAFPEMADLTRAPKETLKARRPGPP